MSRIPKSIFATLALMLSGSYGLVRAQTTALRLSGTCPASVFVGQQFSIPLVASGGNGAYSFTLITSPPWVSLSATSGTAVNGSFSLMLSGTPPGPGTFALEVALFDQAQDSPASFNCSLVVIPPLALSGTCPSTPLAAGSAFSLPLTPSGGNGNYRFSIDGPPWLSVSSTGVVSGTPPSVGTFPFTVVLSDSAGDPPATFSCTLSVNAALSLTGTCPAAPLVAGSSFSLSLRAVGGNGNYRFAISGPSWLSVSNTGIVSGTSPAAGTYPFTVTLTDTAGDAPASFSCTLTVTAPLSLTGTCPAAALSVGSPFSLSVTASGGSGSYRFSISGPSWLSVSSTGVVSGTPPASGTYPFTVTLTDTAGNAPASFSCTLTVTAPLSLTGTCPAAALSLGSPFSLSLTASGGNGNFRFLISGPSWLTVSSTGVVSGIPPASGTYPFTVTVTDTAADQAASFSCSLTVTAPLILTGSCPAAALTAGSPFSISITPGGGNGNYRFSVSGPPWVSVSATGIISGTPPPGTGGTFPFTVTLTDTAGDPAATFSCSITVGAQRVSITSGCPTTSVVQGTAYGQVLSASGGDGNFTWTIASGSLPTGLTLNGNLISGTPLPPPGKSSFVIQVSSAGATDQIGCSIEVAPLPLAITSTCPGNGVQGVAFSPYTISATGGLGSSSYTFSIINGTLPTGLVLVNGVISGTPSGAPGISVFTVQASSGQQTATLGPCSLAIATSSGKSLQLAGVCPGTVTVGVRFSIPLTASGGTPPYKYAVTSGESWITVVGNGSAATVTGVPPLAGTFPFTITLTDAANTPAATFLCSLVATDAVKIQATCPGPIEQNSTLTLPLMASGGKGPYGWSLTGPPWLSLTAKIGDSSTLSGTPPDQGDFPFTITLTDSSGMVDTFTCTLTVTPPAKPPLVITPSGSCPASPIDFAFAFSLSFRASGGVEPYSWTFSGPPWLNLQSKTGTNTSISGTANVEGTAAFTLSLDDSVGSPTVTFSCTIVVNPAVIPSFSLALSQRPATLFDPLPVIATLGGAAPVTLEGDLQVSFTSNAFGTTDNPQVQILDPSATANGRLLHFRIQQGSTSVALTSVQQGTVAGVIRIELISLKDGARDVLSTPHPFLEVTIPKLAPVMTSMTLVNQTANGFDILISGYSTPRDVSTAEVTFTPAATFSIQGPANFSVSTSSLFANFYSASKSQQGGSMFDGLRIPVTISGDKRAIGSVSVKLTNSVGSSDVITKSP